MGRVKKQHTLEPLKRMSYPDAMVFLDTESRVPKPPTKDIFEENDHHIRLVHKLRMAVAERWEWDEESHAYVDRGHGEFLESGLHTPRKIAEALWQYIEDFATSDRNHLYVLAHNIGYDLLASAAYPIFAERGWRSEAVYAKGPVFIQRLEKNHRRITFLSSSNYYNVKLEKLAKSFGMEKGDGDWNGPEEPLLIYCRQDVAILRTAMLWLVNKLREMETPFADTISSVAFKAFRTKFLHHAIDIHTDDRAVRLERRSYGGGRAEPFYVGRLPTLLGDDMRYKVDFTSLYPSVMVDSPMPTRLRGVFQDMTVAELKAKIGRGDAVIADVTVDVRLPCVPLKWSRLLFIVGRQDTVLTTPELQLLLKEGGDILEVREVAVYDQAPIFKEFVAYFWAMREQAIHEGNEAIKQLAKNLQNNLYGKFGQESESWERIGDCPSDMARVEYVTDIDVETGIARNYQIKYYAGGVYRSFGVKSEGYNSFPAIASFVTAYGRCRLWTAMKVSGFGHFYAGDTDSLIVDEQGYWNLDQEGLISEVELGLLKVEETSQAEDDEVWAAKVYRFHGKMTWKGHKSDARKVTDFDGKEKWLQEQWPSLNGMLSQGNGLGEFYNNLRFRDDHPVNVKSVVLPTGWCRPFVWEELPTLSPSQRRDLRLPPLLPDVKNKEKGLLGEASAPPVVAP